MSSAGNTFDFAPVFLLLYPNHRPPLVRLYDDRQNWSSVGGVLRIVPIPHSQTADECFRISKSGQARNREGGQGQDSIFNLVREWESSSRVGAISSYRPVDFASEWRATPVE